jgi:hypothetical protein
VCSAVCQELYPAKNNFGRENVKFRMLYQPLSSMNPDPGKEFES